MHLSRTKAPSLHQHYPASSVLRASPPPQGARPVPHGRPVGYPHTTPRGFPCCVRFPCVHAVATTPAQRLGYCIAHSIQSYQPSPIWQSGRPAQRPFRGLLGVHSRYGLHTRAVTVFRDTLHRRLQPFRCLHNCSGCFRLERLPGGAFTHWENAAFSRRTPTTAIHPLGRIAGVCPRRALERFLLR